MREPTAEQFLKDVADHQMTIPLNEGVYRHVRFRSTKHGWNQWFDLNTWPGHLTISGDMGTWTFSRVPDMFNFFRDDSRMRINPHYWAEKLQHGTFGGRDGAKVWDQDTFQAHLLDQLKNHFEDDPGKLAEVTEAVQENVFRLHDGDGAHMMRNSAYEFTHEFDDRDKFQFEGMDLPSGMVYSFHFIWCLYAIVWGIHKYDNGQGMKVAA